MQPRTIATRLASVLLGLLLGLLIAEGVFWWRDDGAFPHLNLYRADAELGTRLVPGSMRFKLHTNPTTTIHVNQQGYRGADWPAPDGPATLVVGDSQVFGLGVEDDQTAAAQLAKITGRTVLNGGVPTYGPQEYLAIVRQVAETRPLDHVVVVFNFSNDLFEATRPNVERHAVWDGWAVRIETAPVSVAAFPGRDLAMRRSHLVYAARRFLYTPKETLALGLPSEGMWTDLVRDRLLNDPTTEWKKQASKAEVARAEAAREQASAARSLIEIYGQVVLNDYDGDLSVAAQAVTSNVDPGDILTVNDAEAGRSVQITAAMLARGASYRMNMVPGLERWLRQNPRHRSADYVRRKLDEWKKLEAGASAMAQEVLAVPAPRTPLDGALDALAELAEAHGFEVTVAALPLDVQVDAAEWEKYQLEPIDMSSSHVLLDDLVRASKARGMRAVNLVPALRDAQPGAFLYGDLHMTAKGQRAVAEALADTLARPVERLPAPGLPEGRSRVPTAAEWLAAPENSVYRSARLLCQTRVLREWQRITCLPFHCPSEDDVAEPECRTRRATPTWVAIREAPLEAMAFYGNDHTDLVTPMLEGRSLVVDFAWKDGVERLSWHARRGKLGFETLRDPPPAPALTPAQDNARRCLFSAGWSAEFGNGERCGDLFEGDGCIALASCARGQRTAPVECPEGQVVAGSAGWCFSRCSDAKPCDEGVCTDWQGVDVCL